MDHSDDEGDVDLDDEGIDAELEGNYDDDDEVAVAAAAAAAAARKAEADEVKVEVEEEEEEKPKKKQKRSAKAKPKPKKMAVVRKALKAAKKQEQASAPKMDDRIMSLERRITILETENRELKSYKRKHSHCEDEVSKKPMLVRARGSLLMQQPK